MQKKKKNPLIVLQKYIQTAVGSILFNKQWN